MDHLKIEKKSWNQVHGIIVKNQSAIISQKIWMATYRILREINFALFHLKLISRKIWSLHQSLIFELGMSKFGNRFQFTKFFWSTWVHKISLQILFCSSQIHIYSFWGYKRNNLISRKMPLLMSIHVFRSILVFCVNLGFLVYLGHFSQFGSIFGLFWST